MSPSDLTDERRELLKVLLEEEGVEISPVQQIWAVVLKLERVGISENFFDLGGHSLLATQLISRVREAFHVDLPLRSLFETPTIVGLAPTLVGYQMALTDDEELAELLVELEEQAELSR